jgi:hypothetical protein
MIYKERNDWRIDVMFVAAGPEREGSKGHNSTDWKKR